MTIQVQQTFPHCDRCGIMLHHSRLRLETTDGEGKPVRFCTELCRDEYAQLVGLSDAGVWRDGVVGTRAGQRRETAP